MPLSNDLGNFSSQIIPKKYAYTQNFRTDNNAICVGWKQFIKSFHNQFVFRHFLMGLPEFKFLNLLTSKILSKNFLPKKNFNFRSKIYFLSNQMINQIKISPEVFRLDDSTLMSFSLSRGRDFWFVLFSYCLSYIAHFTIHAQSDTVTREVKNREII